jgi:hypothetical protein
MKIGGVFKVLSRSQSVDEAVSDTVAARLAAVALERRAGDRCAGVCVVAQRRARGPHLRPRTVHPPQISFWVTFNIYPWGNLTHGSARFCGRL